MICDEPGPPFFRAQHLPVVRAERNLPRGDVFENEGLPLCSRFRVLLWASVGRYTARGLQLAPTKPELSLEPLKPFERSDIRQILRAGGSPLVLQEMAQPDDVTPDALGKVRFN